MSRCWFNAARFCKDLSDEAFSFLRLVEDKPPYQFQLIELVLGGCVQLSSAVISSIVGCCPALLNLNLWKCHHVNDETLKVISRYCKHLQELQVADVPEVRDAGFEALASGCAGLRVLALGGWLHITDNTIKALSENCPHLEILDMTGCAKIGEESQRLIAEGVFRDKLTTLLAYGAWRLTSAGFHLLGQHCSSLTYVRLGGYGTQPTDLKPEKLDELQKAYPSIRFSLYAV